MNIDKDNITTNLKSAASTIITIIISVFSLGVFLTNTLNDYRNEVREWKAATYRQEQELEKLKNKKLWTASMVSDLEHSKLFNTNQFTSREIQELVEHIYRKYQQ